MNRQLPALAVLLSSLASACSTPTNASDVQDVAPDVIVSETSVDALADSPAPVDVHCTSDRDCDDHLFCNGIERCMPGAVGSTTLGCLPANPTTPCAAGEMCNEAMQRCQSGSCGATPDADADGDGHRSMACGGDDCDDADPHRFPGNPEVCAFDSTTMMRIDPTHDEDCDLSTYANATTRDGDHDGDGYVDRQCCNVDGSGGLHCGNDCADVQPVDGVPASFMTHIAPGNIHPMEAEVCNGVDDDCDDHVDNSLPTAMYYPDCDADSFGGEGSIGMVGCSGEEFLCNGHSGVTNASDCDDTTPSIGVCGTTTNGMLACMAHQCVIATCDSGFTDCDGRASNGCEVHTAVDMANCGACGHVCPSVSTCNNGVCEFVVPAGSPDLNVTGGGLIIPPGRHYYASVTIAAGATLTTTGSGVLEIVASGPVQIDGTIDLSGGPAGVGTGTGPGGGGGATGNPRAFPVLSAGGIGGTAGAGGDGVAAVGSGGVFGGGAGAASNPLAGPGGGGGPAGGGGGTNIACVPCRGGGVGGTIVVGTGAAPGTGGYGGGPPYDGMAAGGGCGGGGGSIGVAAAADLAVTATFYPGSGGGGANFNTGSPSQGAYGGSGGGGALLIASRSSISIGSTGIVRADGGGMQPGAFNGQSCFGGGGSGGVVFIAAPVVNVASGATITALGGRSTTGAPLAPGGLGRIRVAVGSSCSLAGGFTPMAASDCAMSSPSGTPGATFIGPYPF